MAVRTYIPSILAFAKFIARYLNDHAATLKQYMGDGLYAALVLAVDICLIIAQLIEAGHDVDQSWSEFTAVNTLSAADINQIQGAIDKFYASIGVTP